MTKNIAHKIINLDNRDFHMHTSSFSDGINTIDELIIFAGKIWLSEIVITDHSDAAVMWHFQKKWIFPSAARWSLPSYKNMHNDVQITFGVEGDLLDKEGSTCFTIQGKESEFCILSAHSDIYLEAPETVTEGTIKAIEKNVDSIKFIGHPTCNNQFGKYYNLPRLIEAANYWNIPLELNGKSVARWKSDEENVKYVLEHANQLYFNSDAHNLSDLQVYRRETVKMLLDWWYITQNQYDTFLGYFTFV